MQTKEDALFFIKELVNEMDRQDNRCTADPYYFTIQTQEWRPVPDGCSGENGESRTVYADDEDFEVICHSKKECIEHLMEHHEMNRQQAVQASRHHFSEYTEGKFSKYQNFFLTEKACNLHIKQNRHHYNEPQSYVDHAWRNPEIEYLLKAIRILVKEEA